MKLVQFASILTLLPAAAEGNVFDLDNATDVRSFVVDNVCGGDVMVAKIWFVISLTRCASLHTLGFR